MSSGETQLGEVISQAFIKFEGLMPALQWLKTTDNMDSSCLGLHNPRNLGSQNTQFPNCRFVPSAASLIMASGRNWLRPFPCCVFFVVLFFLSFFFSPSYSRLIIFLSLNVFYAGCHHGSTNETQLAMMLLWSRLLVKMG